MLKTLYLGLDVDQKTYVSCFLDQEGRRLEKTRRFPNTLPGTQALETHLLDLLTTHDFQQVMIGSEATSFYDFHVIDYLASSPRLKPFKPLCYRLNARLIKNFKKGYPETDKIDAIDAFTIADRLRFGRLPAPYQANQVYLPLQRLTRYRYHLVKTITAEKNRFLAHLFLKFSGFNQSRPAGKLLSATSEALVTEFFSPDELIAMPLDQLVSFIQQKGRYHFADPQAVAQAVQRAMRESYRISPALSNTIDIILSSILCTIRALTNALKEIDQAITKEFAAFPNTLQSVRGLGPVYSAGIFAELGNIARFSSDAQIAKMAGLVWKRSQSGDFEGDETRLIHSANKYLRYYLVEAANTLRMHNVEYRTFYETKFKEVTKHRHKRALVLTARKLVRLIYALLSKQQLYQPGYQSQPR